MRKRRAQEYSSDEFDAVVAFLLSDPKARRDIEAITGKSLRGKQPREIFDLFLTVQKATEVKATFAAYGRASVILNEVRREVEGQAAVNDALDLAHAEIRDLKAAKESLTRVLEDERTAHNNAIAAPAMAVYAEGTGQ